MTDLLTPQQTNFTSSFLTSLTAHEAKLTAYITSQKSHADALTSALHAAHAADQEGIDALLRQLKSLQYERGVAQEASASSANGGGLAEQRKKLEGRQKKLEGEVEMLRGKKRVEQAQLDDILHEEATLRTAAQAVREKKREIEETKNTTIEDLTKGLLNYQHVGLTFERKERGGLLLDPSDTKRPFSFQLNMNEATRNFGLSECSPSLDGGKIDAILDKLNGDLNGNVASNGWNDFIVAMRKLFKETL
ncbi:predicted protein [Thalassiosira pseudonana CCMP1335]|uniref:Kinetochore protein SPC25 n=1 Tax=Thalassiosira pseudonana TaxID=35128 RepID=B8BS97_THAPS|nr:predicted protein [Thalassiosira pseudonana CCMP1335]EED96090.1 predicted protein [Thalassiosira pseudonana CCMP1335]